MCAYDVANEENFRLTVVDDVVYLLGGELMEYGHCHSPVSECGKESHCPMGGVASAKGNLVATLHS